MSAPDEQPSALEEEDAGAGRTRPHPTRFLHPTSSETHMDLVCAHSNHQPPELHTDTSRGQPKPMA